MTTTNGGNAAGGASLPLTLTGCTLPTWATTVTPAVGNVTLSGVTVAGYNAWNANRVMEAALSTLLSVPAGAISTVASAAPAAGRRHLLDSSTLVTYTVAAVTPTQAAAVVTASSTVTPAALTAALKTAGATMTTVTVASTPAGAPASSSAPSGAAAASAALMAVVAALL